MLAGGTRLGCTGDGLESLGISLFQGVIKHSFREKAGGMRGEVGGHAWLQDVLGYSTYGAIWSRDEG